MSEIIFVKTPSGASAVYEADLAPPVRGDKAAAQQLAKRNKQIAAKLREISREAPSSFHAPGGYATLKAGARMAAGRKQPSAMPGNDSHPKVWPPSQPNHAQTQRVQQARGVVMENKRIHKRLNEIYSSTRPSVAPNHIRLEPVNCIERWQQRTSLYTPPDAPSTSASATARPHGDPQTDLASRRQPSSARVGPGVGRKSLLPPGHGGSGGGCSVVRRAVSAPRQRAPGREVPKTMSHARCAGCSRGQFRGADGVGLQPCRGCGKVYYCGAACAKFDEQSHRQICKFYSNGVWTPAGKRPEDDYWVNNAAMAKARRSLRARMQQGDFTEDEAIEEMERLDALQEAEVAKDRAARERQRHIEWLAYNGMDGPRPCMYNNGKRA